MGELKGILKAQQSPVETCAERQSSFSKPVAEGKASTEAAFGVSNLLAKRKKAFTEGEVIKEATRVAAADTLFRL